MKEKAAVDQRLSLRSVIGGMLAGLAIGLVVFFGIPGPAENLNVDQASSRNQDGGGLAVGQPAPAFTAETVQGDQMALADYEGQVVMLNFWATWCGPCEVEMPHLQARYERFRQDGFVVLAINFDEPRDLVKAYGQEHELSFPLVLDPGGDIQQLYRVRGYPSTYLLDREGQIRDIHIGLMTEKRMDEMLASVGLEGS